MALSVAAVCRVGSVVALSQEVLRVELVVWMAGTDRWRGGVRAVDCPGSPGRPPLLQWNRSRHEPRPRCGMDRMARTAHSGGCSHGANCGGTGLPWLSAPTPRLFSLRSDRKTVA